MNFAVYRSFAYSLKVFSIQWPDYPLPALGTVYNGRLSMAL